MLNKPLHIAFLWHMHQPYYKDPARGVFRLPWVRLHGIKDYLDMVRILEDFPHIRQTFNLVPSLVYQLNDYLQNNATDVYLELTLKDPSSLSGSERIFILENFFLAHWDNMIKPFSRYYELLTKRGFRFTERDIARVLKYFTDADLRDLQVLFNLAWIDPMFRNADTFLSGLVQKGRNFTEEEKCLLIDKQFDILRAIIPEYKKLSDTGQIELSVTPFYHPILPLLWDTDCTKIAMPWATLPKKRFSHPDDARNQIRMAIAFFEKTFGRKPIGMWPSEGSVSEEVVNAIGQEGIKWVATDEEVLSRSLERPLRSPEGYLTDASALYRPYEFAGVSICFRDHKLSDLIGFVYSAWNPDRAVHDMIDKLLQIRDSLPDDHPALVSIILDGENAWEHYKNDGHDFLRMLYQALSNDNRFRTVTISEFLMEYGPGTPLSRLHAGSWINANFSIWTGHEEDNLAWDYLSRTREDLACFAESNPSADLTEAWQALYAAEGSDWNWWYGDEHSTETQTEFDDLFRGYLMKVYRTIGKDIPQFLYVPVLLTDRSIRPTTQARGFAYPKIDGIVTSYFEWNQGAKVDVKKSGGSMHRTDSLISTLYYAFNQDNLYIRVDPALPFTEMRDGIIFCINIMTSSAFRVVFDMQENPWQAHLLLKVSNEWRQVRIIDRVAARDILEIEIPFADIKARENDEIHFFIDIIKNHEDAASTSGNAIERCPSRGYITLTVPSPDYEKLMWY